MNPIKKLPPLLSSADSLTEAETIQYVQANGLRFGYIEQGEGPLVLLLHGFPDNAYTYRNQLKAFADAGYHAVAPFLRGYAPTDIPKEEAFDPATLGEDIHALIQALSDNGKAYVMGMDWGGTAIRGTMLKHQDSIAAAVIMNNAHQSTGARVVRDPASIRTAFQVWFFQMPGAATFVAEQPDLAMVDYLWNLWSPVLDEEAHIRSIKDTLSVPGVLPAALTYYRELVTASATGKYPSHDIHTPTLAIYGQNDGACKFSETEAQFFKGPYDRVVLNDVGHWPHLEKAAEVNEMALDWFRRHPVV